jgi:hypothetical protein
MSDETLRQNPVLQAIADLSKSINERFLAIENQLEIVREDIVHNSARFDQLEAIALDAKSIALITRSQLTILTEELRQSKSLVLNNSLCLRLLR